MNAEFTPDRLIRTPYTLLVFLCCCLKLYKISDFAPRFSDRVADAGTVGFVAFVAAVRVSKLPQIET